MFVVFAQLKMQLERTEAILEDEQTQRQKLTAEFEEVRPCLVTLSPHQPLGPESPGNKWVSPAPLGCAQQHLAGPGPSGQQWMGPGQVEHRLEAPWEP